MRRASKTKGLCLRLVGIWVALRARWSALASRELGRWPPLSRGARRSRRGCSRLHVKALSARRRRTDAELDEATVSTVPDAADDPEVALQKKNRAEALRQSSPRLSPEHREVIDLAYYHGKSVKEITEIVGSNEATVKTRMFYARKKLAELGAQA